MFIRNKQTISQYDCTGLPINQTDSHNWRLNHSSFFYSVRSPQYIVTSNGGNLCNLISHLTTLSKKAKPHTSQHNKALGAAIDNPTRSFNDLLQVQCLYKLGMFEYLALPANVALPVPLQYLQLGWFIRLVFRCPMPLRKLDMFDRHYLPMLLSLCRNIGTLLFQ